MTFLHPLLLAAGLSAIAIPVVIHLLLRMRRKPIEFAAMRFLLEAFKKQQRTLQVQQWLLLLTRCLIVLCLAMAIARPLLERAGVLGGGSGRALYLLIDNSIAGQVRDDQTGETALDRHKAQAIAMLDGLGPGDVAGLVALGSPAEPLVVPASSDVMSLRRLIEQLAPTDGGADIRGAFESLADAINVQGDAERASATLVAVLSDFSEGVADLTKPLPESLAGIEGVTLLAPQPTQDAASNIQIIDVDPLRDVVLTGSGGVSRGEQVRIRLRRTGDALEGDLTTRVRLSTLGARGELNATTSTGVRWEPGQDVATAVMQVDASVRDGADVSVLVAEIDRDALAGDNTFRRPVRVREALTVVIADRRRFGGIGRADELAPGDWYRLALKPVDEVPIDVVSVEPAGVDRPTLANADALVIPEPDQLSESSWEAAEAFVRRGGMIVVSPPSAAEVNLWTDNLTDRFGLDWSIAREAVALDGATVQAPDIEDDLLALLSAELTDLVEGVGVRRAVPIIDAGDSGRVLLALSNGTPWLLAGRVRGPSQAGGSDVDNTAGEGGVVALFASAPDLGWTDLPARPLMVPLLQELVRQGVGASLGSSVTVAGRGRVPPLVAGAFARLDGVESVSSDALPAGSAIRRAGVWAPDNRAQRGGVIAVNADVDAARTGLLDPEALRGWLASAQGGEALATSVTWLDPDEVGAALEAGDRGSPLALPLFIAALLLALAETVMARWFSHAGSPRAPGLSAGASGLRARYMGGAST